LASAILRHRKAYYDALEAANKNNQITEWLIWFAGVAIEANQYTLALTDFLINKTRLFDRLKDQLNDRQKKALLRMFKEGPTGFKGGLSAGNYGVITDASPATTTRDLVDLVDKGALVRVGELKHTRYYLAIPIRPINNVIITKEGDVLEEIS
jgi:Fic family protein